MERPGKSRDHAQRSRWRQYRLRSLLLLIGVVAVACWWFRPESDPTGAVVAVYARMIEDYVSDVPSMVVYTSLDDSAIRRLRARLGRPKMVIRGMAEAKQCIRPKWGFYSDKPTGQRAVEVSVTLDSIKPGRATGKASFVEGWDMCGFFHFVCTKHSGRWVVEIVSGGYS
ncbi:MAG: hypothetical protein ISR77_08730 [Pirellulaceae bacterium]|nr:hypothetical protein [Pirellulaceae bacterium]